MGQSVAQKWCQFGVTKLLGRLALSASYFLRALSVLLLMNLKATCSSKESDIGTSPSLRSTVPPSLFFRLHAFVSNNYMILEKIIRHLKHPFIP